MRAIPAAIARGIRLVILDVDGVLTDGGIYLGAAGDGTAIELKRFEITDQLGIKMMVWAGLEVVLVSGRVSAANRIRAEELGIAFHEGPGGRKLAIAEELIARHGIGWDHVACLCDDLPDMALLTRAGLPAAVANAVPEVRAVAVWSSRRSGGHGAVREFAEALLRARGEWTTRVRAYLEERDAAVPT